MQRCVVSGGGRGDLGPPNVVRHWRLRWEPGRLDARGAHGAVALDRVDPRQLDGWVAGGERVRGGLLREHPVVPDPAEAGGLFGQVAHGQQGAIALIRVARYVLSEAISTRHRIRLRHQQSQ